MKTPFSQLSQELQLIYLTIPVYLPTTQNPDVENEQQVIARQERFLKLPKNIRWKLASFDIGDRIEAIGRKYGFELLRLANITRLIREYYFGEMRFEDFATEIEQRVGVNLLTAQEIARYIKQEIIDWDPWGEYLAKLPKMPVRSIVQQYPKIANTEITAGYIELRNSDDLEDPTIKNWLQDYISHLGYEKHSQMDRTQYIFHSENAKNLSSQDREKLGIILRSFDENIPLPVDEENGEIVFDGMMSEPASSAGKQESFIKPYAPVSQPQRQIAPPPAPRPLPLRQASAPPQNFLKPNPAYAKAPAGKPVPPPPQEFIHPNFVTQPNRQARPEIDKYFNAPESSEIPSIKVHSITEHNEPRIEPQQNIQHPASPQLSPAPRPQHRIIDPFGPRIVEPKIDGNIVDLSGEE